MQNNIPIITNNLFEIINDYQVFVFDLCGVVHNGEKLFADVIQLINEIRKVNKHIIFLSNSPRSSQESAKNLCDMGFEIRNEEKIITSGDYFINQFQNNKTFLNKKLFCLTNGKSKDYYIKQKLHIVESPEEADYFISTAFTDDNNEKNNLIAKIEYLSKNFPKIMLVPNPDIFAPHGEIMRWTPGFFGKKYQELNNQIISFGKPNKDFFEFALDEFLRSLMVKKHEVLMIGDSLNTDIAGANQYEIDSLLLLKRGIYRDSSFNSMSDITNLLQQNSAFPNLIFLEASQ